MRRAIAKIFGKPKDTERVKRRRSSRNSKTSSSEDKVLPPYAGKRRKLATDNHNDDDFADSSTDGLKMSSGMENQTDSDNLTDDLNLELTRNDADGYNIQVSESALCCLKIADVQNAQRYLDNNGHPMSSVISVSGTRKEMEVECIAPSALGGPDKISKQFTVAATYGQIFSRKPPPLIPFSCLKADPMLVFPQERMVYTKKDPQHTYHDILEDLGLQDDEVDLNVKNINDNFDIQSSQEANFWADLTELDRKI